MNTLATTDTIELMYETGWTDGLPTVPPTRDKVEQFVGYTGRPADDLIAELPPLGGRATVERIAVNAVMAGCLPEHMPVVIAAIEALIDDRFNLRGVQCSTGIHSPLIIVNGPLAQTLNINSSYNCFAQGWRANATIGRAVRLIMMNAINTRPGKLDRSTIGSPGKFTQCFAENEAESPWTPFHVERGFQPVDSTVTVFASEVSIQVYNQLSNTAEQLLLPFADVMGNLGSMNIPGQAQLIVIFGGEHCVTLKKSGWSKPQIREYLYEKSKRKMSDIQEAGRLAGPVKPGDDSRWRHPVPSPDDILVVAAGGSAGSFSAVLMGWGSAKHSRSITTAIATS